MIRAARLMGSAAHCTALFGQRDTVACFDAVSAHRIARLSHLSDGFLMASHVGMALLATHVIYEVIGKLLASSRGCLSSAFASPTHSGIHHRQLLISAKTTNAIASPSQSRGQVSLKTAVISAVRWLCDALRAWPFVSPT